MTRVCLLAVDEERVSDFLRVIVLDVSVYFLFLYAFLRYSKYWHLFQFFLSVLGLPFYVLEFLSI